MNVVSETGGAFMSPSKCDADGNLYIRKYAMDRPLLGPVAKIDPDGKRIALFDPAVFSQLALDRADAFSPASDGGMYQIAQSGVLKPRIYVLHFSSDGSPASPTLLDAEFEVYTFAAFANGNFLVSGVKRDVRDRNDRGRNFTAVFSTDGRELAQLSFPEPQAQDPQKAVKTGRRPRAASQKSAPPPALEQMKSDAEKSAPTLDLADAEVGSDGNLYVMRGSSPALIYVIAPGGKILLSNKLVDRHPHVFGEVKADTPAEVLRNWEALKAQEKEKKKRLAAGGDTKAQQTGDAVTRPLQEAQGAGQPADDSQSVLSGVSTKMPALLEAYKLSSRAAHVGFDWPEIEGLFAKLEEETAELREELKAAPVKGPSATGIAGSGKPRVAPELRERLEDEVGDLFFVLVNIARYLSLDPESALRKTNRKFKRRFQWMEERLRDGGRGPQQASMDELENLWQQAKRQEKPA
jgi:NTP pyrophosphatase (non-canonical NTP hydrolase)